MYYNKPKDFSGNTRIFWLFCFFANDKGGLFDGNTVECCADLRRYIEMNGLKHTKRKSFHQVLAVALCFCTVVTSCPGMPTVLPVFAAQTEGEGLSAPEEGTVQSATPFAEEGGTGNGTDILTGSGTGNDTDMPTEDGAGDGTDMPTEDGQGENTNTSDGNKTEDGTDVPDEDGAEADASQLGEKETDGDEEPEDDKENGQNDPADSVAEPVMTGWHFGEDAVSPQGGLFYEEETYRLILAGGSSEVQIPFEDIVSLLPTSVTVELAYPVSDSAYPDRQLSDADASGADSQTENTDAESSASLSAGETVLAVTGWSCPEYVRDGEGLLPYRGSFFFQAQLGEEGAPFAGDARIEVEVVFDEPMTLAEVTTAVPGTITSNQTWGEQTLSAGIYTIKPGVTVTLTGRLTVSENVTINGGGTIVRDAGYTIGTSGNYGDKGCFFYVKNMGTLTLENITLDGNLVNAQGPVLYIDANSTVNLRNGSVIQNNININTGGTGAYAGGAIYCGGTLNIDGGSIRNCSTSGLIENNLYANAGGAIYLRGTCKMTSGSITGNSASNGGGIYLVSSNARLTLSGGTISGNTANGNGNGIYYSTLNSATSILTIGGNVNIADVIYLDNSTGSLCPKITSELKYPISLACSSKTEGRVLAKGSGYTLTGVDASKVSMTGTTLFSKLNSADNAIVLSSVEEAEATWQETAGGEWKTGKFTTALANVYNGGTIKLLTDVLITEKVEITKQITITSNNAASPCTMTRMPKGEWGNITLSESGALTLTSVIYDGNRDFLSGAENAVKQSLIKVGSNGDTGASLTLGNGCIIRNGYKEGGSGVIAVYGTLNMAGSAVIENCEVSGTGGAVWVSASGNFTMSGGTIRGCKANGGSAVSVDGTCVLKGGSITGNMDTSDKDCAVLLRNSGNGVVTVNGTSISGHTNSIYNDGKRVVIAGNSQLSGAIYTTNGVSAEGSGVSALSVNIVIRMQDTSERPLTLGVTVVAGSKDKTHYQLANETFGLGVSGNDLVTVISDAEKVEEAKKIVEEVLLNLTVTNDTTKQEIQDQINEALRDAGIGSDVTVTVGDFDKTNATTSATGSVSGKVTIASGSATEDVTIDKLIAKLPKTDAEKVADAKKVVEDVLSNYTATNDTTKQEIQDKIDEALRDAGIGSDVTATVSSFNKTNATSGAAGSIGGNISVASGSATENVTIDKPIAKLPDTSGGNSGSSDGNTGNGNAGGSTGNGGSAGNGGTGNTGGIGGNNGNIIAEVITQDNTPEAGFATPAEELADSSLTAEEKQQAQDGTDIRIILHVEDASARVSASEKAVVEANLQGYTVGQYLDISLYKLVGQSRTQITETTGKIRITLEIPESLRLSDTNGSNAGNAGHADGGTDAADAETPQIRQFAILRVHDGQTQILPDLDDQADTVTIETDRFSTYVLVFLDKEADDESGMNQTGTEEQSTAGTGTAAGGGKDDEPKTGEVSPIQLYATLSMIAGFTYLLTYFTDRRGGMSEETKKELVSKLIAWAKKGKLMRRYLALAAIFMLLVYYHSIGKKTNVEWKEVYEK